MTHPASPWLSRKKALALSPWKASTMHDLLERGLIASQRIDGLLMIDAQSFYLAMGEELALRGFVSSREVARLMDVSHEELLEELLEELEAGEMEAYETDIEWYLLPEDIEHLPTMMTRALQPASQTWSSELCDDHDVQEEEEEKEPLQPPLSLSSTRPPAQTLDTNHKQSSTWIAFKRAVRQSAFTHAELHQAVRTGHIESKRRANGQLLVSWESVEKYLPNKQWLPLEEYTSAMSARQARQITKRCRRGEFSSRLVGGVWYIQATPQER